MLIDNKNQNDIIDEELKKTFKIEYNFENKHINRVKTKPEFEDKVHNLQNLKNKIMNINDCKLKSSASSLVFSDGNAQSKIMIVGEGPGQKEDELGIPFVGDAGKLLDKMLLAINLKRKDVYITNVLNYRPPNNRKPEPGEINRYSIFLKEHISIIDPKILILMGSTAMESLLGSGLKISKERGNWKEILIYKKSYLTMITFHPAYLLRQADQKKFSWEDLKKIKKKIEEFN